MCRIRRKSEHCQPVVKAAGAVAVLQRGQRYLVTRGQSGITGPCLKADITMYLGLRGMLLCGCSDVDSKRTGALEAH